MSNSFWNFVTQFVPGELAKAEDVNTNLSGVAGGLDLVETELGKSLQVTNAAGVTNIVLNAAARAGKLISFDINGDLAVTTIMGDWKGDHADAAGTDYQIRDVVRDSQGRIDLASLYICIETHTSTGNILTDTAKWELLLASSTNIAENVTLDNTGLIVVDETNVKDWILSADAALYKARGTGVTSTYVNTAGAGGTTFAQGAVAGEMSSDEGYASFSYAGATGITVNDLTATSTWVYIDKNGNLGQQTTIPTRQDKTRKAFTMRIGVDAVLEQIIAFEYYNNPIGHYTNTMRDIYEFLRAAGVAFRKDQLITGRADLGFDVSAGTILEFGGTGDIFNPNIKPFDAATNVSYNWMSRTELISSETNLLKYWDNAGSLNALASTTLVGHRLYRYSSGNFAMQAGQAQYANMLLAKAGVLTEEYVLNPALKDATFFGWWFIESTATVTNGTTLTDFKEYTIGLQGGSSSSLSGALLKGDNGLGFLDYAVVRTNLGLQIGVDVQAFSTNLNNVNQGLATTDSVEFDQLGIGTSSPSSKLEVKYDTAASSDLDATAFRLYNGSDGGSAIEFSNVDGANSKISFGVESTGSGTDDSYIGFSTGPNGTRAEAMRIDSSGNVIPGTPETQDFGSAEKEWDNIFLQNAATVSDERRKKDIATIDNASAFLRLIDPVWFTYTDKVIPAETKEVKRQVTVTKQREETTIKIMDGKPVQVVKTVDYEEKQFTNEPVLDEVGNAVLVEEVPLTYKMPVMETVTETVAEKIISHSRPHTGFPAQQIKSAMTAAGYDDWAGYAYDEGEDLHMLRLTEMIAFAVKGWQESDKRLAALESLSR
jgi:hypothetical protein